MMNNTHIMMASSADVPLLTGLVRDSFRDVAERFGLTAKNCPKHPSNCTEEWIKKDLARGVTYYILGYEGSPVGCVALEKANSELWYLKRLAVLPAYRHQSLGKALVYHIFHQARAVGAQEISIGIISKQTELKHWYQKLGFVEGETKEFAYLPFQITLMTCNLNR